MRRDITARPLRWAFEGNTIIMGYSEKRAVESFLKRIYGFLPEHYYLINVLTWEYPRQISVKDEDGDVLIWSYTKL